MVYVEAVAGKTFPAPAKPFEMDQKVASVSAALLVVPVGATVEFLNSDKVAHNIFWPAISGNKKLGHNMGTWPTGEKRAFKFDTPGCGAAVVQCSPGDVRLHHRDSHAVLCGNRRMPEASKSPMFPTAATPSRHGMKA